jgi:hypothetical protein
VPKARVSIHWWGSPFKTACVRTDYVITYESESADIIFTPKATKCIWQVLRGHFLRCHLNPGLMVGNMPLTLIRTVNKFMLFGNLALRSLANVQGGTLLSRFSALLRLQFRGKHEPVQVSHTSATVQILYQLFGPLTRPFYHSLRSSWSLRTLSMLNQLRGR